MREQGVYAQQSLIADAAYALPAIDWIKGEFSNALRRAVAALNLEQWRENENDCDNFAGLAKEIASICHARSARKSGYGGTGLAFGEFWYLDTQQGHHAINVAIVGNLDALRLVFFEPQTGELVTLSEKERSLCDLYRF
jgi:hypothetical protein